MIMNLISEEYLAHYGVKGMKWKKRKFGAEDNRPEDKNKGTEPGSYGLEKSDNFDPLKNVPTAADKAMAKQRRQEIEKKAKARRAVNKYNRSRENRLAAEQGNAMRRARTTSGSYATTELSDKKTKRGNKNYVLSRMYTTESAHLKKSNKK